MENYILVFCTIDTKENAQMLAHSLAEEKLAACVNLINDIKSVYFWNGKLNENSEILLLIKTRQDLYEKLETRIKQLHPYEVPEIICTKIDTGSKTYLDWIKENTLD